MKTRTEIIRQIANGVDITDITDIILDWDETIVSPGEARTIEGYIEGLKQFQVYLTPKENERVYRQSEKRIYDVTTAPFELGACKDKEMLRYVSENPEAVREAIEESMLEETMKCFEFQGFKELCSLSKKHGIKLHVYTMRWTNLIKKEVQRRGLESVFESVNGSTKTLQKSDEGAIKQRMPQLKPDTTLFIGDGKQDCMAAKSFGCWFFQIGHENFGDYKKVRQFKNLERAVGAVGEIKKDRISSIVPQAKFSDNQHNR